MLCVYGGFGSHLLGNLHSTVCHSHELYGARLGCSSVTDDLCKMWPMMLKPCVLDLAKMTRYIDVFWAWVKCLVVDINTIPVTSRWGWLVIKACCYGCVRSDCIDLWHQNMYKTDYCPNMYMSKTACYDMLVISPLNFSTLCIRINIKQHVSFVFFKIKHVTSLSVYWYFIIWGACRWQKQYVTFNMYMLVLKAADLHNILENQIFQNISLNTYNSC